MSVPTDRIRNVALVGHSGTGKTTLMEQILVHGGVVPKFDPGKSVSDCTEEEIARKISIYSAFAHFDWDGRKVNVIDTPGSGDFIGEVVAALGAAECAIVVVGADVGVQIETAKLWRRLERDGTPRIVFVNGMDKEHADFDSVLEDLGRTFGGTFAPLSVPIGAGNAFEGVVDVVGQRALLRSRSGDAPIPDGMGDAIEERRLALMEAAAEGDDTLMEKYLEDEMLTDDEILRGMTEAVAAGQVFPVLAGSALHGAGIPPLLDAIVRTVPSPAGTTVQADGTGETTSCKIDPSGPASALVLKTSVDQYAGRLSFVKVITGRLRSDADLICARTGAKIRVTKLSTRQGEKLEDVQELSAGDIGVLNKLSDVTTCDTLHAPEAAVTYAPLDFPQPVHALALRTTSKQDDDKLSEIIGRTADSDPTFRVRYNGETRETVVAAIGELHLAVVLGRIRDGHKIEVETDLPSVAYRETINRPAAADYQHKKQTGGHGQYAKVSLEIKPLPRGEKFRFENGTVGGSISRGYIPGVEKGVREALESGVLGGYPVVDVEAKVVDGREHSVDSSELAFKLAAREATKAALAQAKPVLLEPVVDLVVLSDDQYLGDILSDLSSRRGRVLGQEPIGSLQETRAQVPQAEMLRYSIDLKSMTSGTASFEVEFDHYAPLTGRLADDVIKRSQAVEAAAAGR
jgi:elongation factor G